jgi:hypothetical protein
MLRQPRLSAVILITGIGAILGACEYASTQTCLLVRCDPNGYLRKICEYIHKQQIPTGTNPANYNIRRIVESTGQDGKPTIEVWLDCCYMGDVAIFDKTTGEIWAFHLGPR